MACTCLYTCLSLFIQFGMKTLEKTSPPWSANRLRKMSSKLRTKEQGSLCVVLDIDVRIMLQPRETWIAVTMLSINSYLDFEIFGYEWTQWCRMHPSIKAILANWVWWRAPDAYHFEYFSKIEAGQKTQLTLFRISHSIPIDPISNTIPLGVWLWQTRFDDRVDVLCTQAMMLHPSAY